MNAGELAPSSSAAHAGTSGKCDEAPRAPSHRPHGGAVPHAWRRREIVAPAVLHRVTGGMPGIPHEVMVAMLREQPSVLAALVQVLTGRTLVSGLAPDDSTVRFVKTAEVRPDILFVD